MKRLEGYEVIVEAEGVRRVNAPKSAKQRWPLIAILSLVVCSSLTLLVLATSGAGAGDQDQRSGRDDALEGSPPLDSLPTCLIAKHRSGDQPLSPQLMDSAPATFLSSCADWVINTTDQVWNPILTDEEVELALKKYFTADFTSHGSWGAVAVGWEALQAAVFSTRRAFPDLRIYATDVMCYGNDLEGYKTTMPDVLQGTNTGPSAYGPATGRRVSYSGIANCFVVRDADGEWKYQAEWVLHDEWSLLTQLGLLDSAPHPDSLTHPNPDCSVNNPNWATATLNEEHRRSLTTEDSARSPATAQDRIDPPTLSAERRVELAEQRIAELEAELARYTDGRYAN